MKIKELIIALQKLDTNSEVIHETNTSCDTFGSYSLHSLRISYHNVDGKPFILLKSGSGSKEHLLPKDFPDYENVKHYAIKEIRDDGELYDYSSIR